MTSVKYFSNPAGEMISRRLASVSPAFQNACHWPRGWQMTPPAENDLVAEQGADAAVQDDAVLVLAAVAVTWGRQSVRLEGVLNQREPAVSSRRPRSSSSRPGSPSRPCPRPGLTTPTLISRILQSRLA